MKRLLTFVLLPLAAVAAAQQTTPPAFNGMTNRFFAARLSDKAAKAAVAQGIPADSLSPQTVVVFRVDTTGAVSDWQYPDDTRTGRDSCDLPPATPATRRLLEQAYAGMEGSWTPGERNGRKIPCRVWVRVNMPLEAIARAQGCVEPLLFLGKPADRSFYDWARVRVRYDERYAVRRAQGVYRVRFFIEPDGTLTFGEAPEFVDEKLLCELIRVIRRSRGKWTPRKVRGIPQRTEFVYSMNYL